MAGTEDTVAFRWEQSMCVSVSETAVATASSLGGIDKGLAETGLVETTPGLR